MAWLCIVFGNGWPARALPARVLEETNAVEHRLVILHQMVPPSCKGCEPEGWRSLAERTGLENRSAPLGYRGFKSLPFRRYYDVEQVDPANHCSLAFGRLTRERSRGASFRPAGFFAFRRSVRKKATATAHCAPGDTIVGSMTQSSGFRFGSGFDRSFPGPRADGSRPRGACTLPVER